MIRKCLSEMKTNRKTYLKNVSSKNKKYTSKHQKHVSPQNVPEIHQ